MRKFSSKSTAAGAAVLALLTAAGCSSSSSGSSAAGSPAPAGPVSMEFWGWAPGYDKIVDQWNAAHPDVHVTFKKIPSGGKGGYDQMTNALAAGNGPCLAQVTYNDIPSMLVKNALVDITQYAQGDMAKFAPSAAQASTAGGKVYGIPVDIGPMALFYRTDLFAKYGITKPPATWDEYQADAQKVAAADPTVAFGNAPQDAYDMSALAEQAGQPWFSTSGSSWTVSVDNPGTAKVAQYWQTLKDQKLVMNSGNAWDASFEKAAEQGKVLTFVNAVWASAGIKDDLKDLAGKWAVAPMPTWSASDKASANSGGSDTSVLRGCKSPQQAEQFAVWMATDTGAVTTGIKEGGLYPASTAGQSNPLLSQADPYYGTQNIYDVFKQSAANVPTNWVVGPTFGQMESDYTDAIGKSSYAAATATVQKNTIAAIKNLGLSVSNG
ncbi:ABC transporter substrate-binding protein [Kitasatospora sp. NPDC006697]|uniref:ABC transporter substrate-binding protein n=1 Tax=Kitasatospora sp. NPDC006697 TaxID=3364020 RepID=UPI003697553A